MFQICADLVFNYLAQVLAFSVLLSHIKNAPPYRDKFHLFMLFFITMIQANIKKTHFEHW